MNLPGQQSREGRLEVYQESLVDSVLYHYEQLRLKLLDNPDHNAIPGFRIQIFFDSGLHSSDRAWQAKEQFSKKYPEVQAYVSWKSPNYRVRVGDFKNRLEAEKFLQRIMNDYPNGWVIRDEINFPIIN
ncbi:MAG: SPOR domain-containing protein [Bacteroidales bacterium]|nr:SPOR domain-containing protein [Bacteroidales bacterium]